MSYDLYFYNRKGDAVSFDTISRYLSDNYGTANEQNNQWFFENEDTEVYYSFDYNDVEEYEDAESEPIEDFDDTGFSFNLNFMRPGFFGLEAFEFVEKFCDELNLFVLNPQGDAEKPYKPEKQEQFDNWNKTNRWASATHFNDMESCYMADEKTIPVWMHNRNRAKLQQQLGDDYFVPKIFFFKTIKTNEAFTLTSWTEHIPTLLPESDYVFLLRKYKKFFRTIQNTALISRQTFLREFGGFFEKSDSGYWIIHPEKAKQAATVFNPVKSEQDLEKFAERLPVERLFNAKPD